MQFENKTKMGIPKTRLICTNLGSLALALCHKFGFLELRLVNKSD